MEVRDRWTIGVAIAALVVSILALGASVASAVYTYRTDKRAELATYPRVNWEIKRPTPREFEIIIHINNTDYGQIKVEYIYSREMKFNKIKNLNSTSPYPINQYVNTGEALTLNLVGTIDPYSAAQPDTEFHFELFVSGGSLPRSPFIFAVNRIL